MKKIPVLLVVGKKEQADQTVTIRQLGSEKQEVKPLADVIKQFKFDSRFPSVEYED